MCQKIPNKSEKILKNIKKIPNIKIGAVIAKNGQVAYVIIFFISWKNPKKSEKILKNIKKFPNVENRAAIAKNG